MRERLPVSIVIAGTPVSSETLMPDAGAHVVVLSTTVASPHAPYGLHSTYVGDRAEATAATHLLLAPRQGAQLTQRRHAAGELPVDDDRQLCLYDHLQELLAALVVDGHEARIDVADRSVELVNR